MLDKQKYAIVTAVVFLAVFVLHGFRLYFGWDAAIGGWQVPMWLSWIALLVAGFLSYAGFAASGLCTRGQNM